MVHFLYTLYCMYIFLKTLMFLFLFSVFSSRLKFLSVKNPEGSELMAGNLVDVPLNLGLNF
jgi:hypothetical protein